MCSRCVIGADHHNPQDTTDGSGRHSHNGEILQYLRGAAPGAERILTAYAEYLRHDPPKDIQAQLAHGYNNPVRAKRLPQTPVAVAARRLMDHRNETWIRHGLEQTAHADYQLGTLFPPPDSRYDIGDQARGPKRSLQRYAVDQDRFPFVDCSEHRLDWDSGAPWAFTAGYVPLSVFEQHSGTLYKPADRDHLYARADILAEQWTYVIWEYGHRVDRIQQQTRAREQLLHSTLPVIHIRSVRKLSQLTNILQCYADTHRLTRAG
jgi:hypothetical protein